MSSSPKLGLSYLVSSQAQKETTHNEALNDLDALVQLCVTSRTISTPPTSPADGDVYIVGASPTGDWAGQANAIALYFSGWRFKTPLAGWVAYAKSESRFIVYNGSAWVPLGAAYLSGSLTWAPGTIVNGLGVTSAAIAVSGASLGDFVEVAAPYDLAGVCATAYVSAAGYVTVRLNNATGASVSLVSGVWNVRVRKA